VTLNVLSFKFSSISQLGRLWVFDCSICEPITHATSADALFQLSKTVIQNTYTTQKQERNS
jgi:hypothetical protein